LFANLDESSDRPERGQNVSIAWPLAARELEVFVPTLKKAKPTTAASAHARSEQVNDFALAFVRG
jgi:hypothetical protein